MPLESLEEEVLRLRAEVEAHRLREFENLQSALAAAQEAAAHYRSEAIRNVEIGKTHIRNLEEDNARLRTELNALKAAESNARRYPAPARN